MNLSTANIFVTGGAGTLGRAIARRRQEEGWTGKLSVYSTDSHKHDLMRREFPDITFIQGDIRNEITLRAAMAGHDVVIHAAAVKVIPDSEYYSIDTFDVNVNGSLAVATCAAMMNIRHVVGISTDKACHPANAYGATKMMMEKLFQEFARSELHTMFHLVRYGNVLESNSSVIPAWKKALAKGEAIKITDPEMTRFWISPRQAVDFVVKALDFKTGMIFVPEMPALSIYKLALYSLGVEGELEYQKIPIRPGEKKHETLLTVDEAPQAVKYDYGYVVAPSTTTWERFTTQGPYTSENARELTRDELLDLLHD